MPSWFTWIRYLILATVFFFLFGKKAKANEIEAKVFTDEPILKKHCDEFLFVSLRPDWGDKDFLGVMFWMHQMLDEILRQEIYNLPEHYFYAISDERLNESAKQLTKLTSLLNAEITRRSV